jgi:hypothetical protein
MGVKTEGFATLLAQAKTLRARVAAHALHAAPERDALVAAFAAKVI